MEPSVVGVYLMWEAGTDMDTIRRGTSAFACQLGSQSEPVSLIGTAHFGKTLKSIQEQVAKSPRKYVLMIDGSVTLSDNFNLFIKDLVELKELKPEAYDYAVAAPAGIDCSNLEKKTSQSPLYKLPGLHWAGVQFATASMFLGLTGLEAYGTQKDFFMNLVGQKVITTSIPVAAVDISILDPAARQTANICMSVTDAQLNDAKMEAVTANRAANKAQQAVAMANQATAAATQKIAIAEQAAVAAVAKMATTVNAANSYSKTPQSNSLPWWAILLIVLAVIILIILIIMLVWWCQKNKSSATKDVSTTATTSTSDKVYRSLRA
jgi:uncharacterized membrane protein